MTNFFSALWAEALKARRSRRPFFTTAGFLILPLVSGLFMLILKDPEKAKEMGIISVKAQLTGGVADWPSLFEMLKMGTGVAGLILFAIITAWVFGREFVDHTAKELLALPTPRGPSLAPVRIDCALDYGTHNLYFPSGIRRWGCRRYSGVSPALAWRSFGSCC